MLGGQEEKAPTRTDSGYGGSSFGPGTYTSQSGAESNTNFGSYAPPKASMLSPPKTSMLSQSFNPKLLERRVSGLSQLDDADDSIWQTNSALVPEEASDEHGELG